MSDLISRQDAIDMIRNHWSDFSNAANYRTAKACVDAVPSAQPEIIRCKGCKWWDRYNDNNGYCMAAKSCTYTSNWDIQIRRTYDGDFYCAHAEPKEEYEEDEDE